MQNNFLLYLNSTSLKKLGVFLTAIITLFFIILIFKSTLLHLNSTPFSNDGDGLQIYYTSAYHAKFDKDFLSQSCINYPDKENVFFTACQPLLTGILKILHLGNYTFGFTNFLMLFSLILCSIYLFLIFNKLNVHYVTSIIFSVIITFLSPQIARLTSHYVLTYQFAIPALIYYMLVFSEFANYKNSFKISALVFILSTIHLYFYGFFILIVLAFYLMFLFKKIKNIKLLLNYFLYFFIQIILPYLLLILILKFGVNYDDRSKYPYGFLNYTSNIYGIFYPFNLPQEFISKLINLKNVNVDFEGISYVGVVATLVCVYLIIKLFLNLVRLKFKKILMPTQFIYINILLLISIIALLYSFGYPFIFGYEKLVYKMSIIAQMRASGRFAWLFFYVINIVSVLLLSNFIKKVNNSLLKYSLLAICTMVMGYEAFSYSYLWLKSTKNKLDDFTAIAHQQKYYSKNLNIPISNFQAILPLPYYQVGSEHKGFVTLGHIQRYSYMLSLETSLPLIAATGSRLSLSKSFNHIPIALEPTGIYPQCYKDFPNNKDVLIITENNFLSVLDVKLLKYSKQIYNSADYSLFSISIKNLKEFYFNYTQEKIKEIELFNSNIKYLQKTQHQYNYSYLKNQTDFFANYKGELANLYNLIYDDTLKVIKGNTNHYVSFWYKNFNFDRYSRTMLEVITYNDSLKNYASLLYASSGDLLKQYYKGYGLIEFTFKPIPNHNKLKVVLWNYQLGEKDSLYFCNVLLRNDSINIYKKIKNIFIKNNYIYLNEN